MAYKNSYRAALRKARENGHAVKFGGGTSASYWWECECGASGGRHPEPPFLVAAPYEDPFDRTFVAHSHMLDAAGKGEA